MFGAAVLLGNLLFKLVKLIWNNRYRFPKLKINRSAPQVSNTISAQNNIVTPVQATELVAEKRYALKDSLLTPAEKDFLEVLRQIVGDKYSIELQVPLSRIVSPIDSNAHFTNYRDFNKISAKSIDFVLYDKEYKPYLAIELDDRSHSRWNRIKRDAFVNDVMESVGLRIVHVPVSKKYDVDHLRNVIASNLS
jgi:hypothetical protein